MNPKQQAAALRELRSMDGWRVVEDLFARKVQYHAGQLETCNIDKVDEHRAALKIYRGISVQLDEIIQLGDNAEEGG